MMSVEIGTSALESGGSQAQEGESSHQQQQEEQSTTYSGGDEGYFQSTNATATSHHSSAASRQLQFACLFTKHKTQKRKIWQDGRLVVCHQNSRLARLHNANPPPGSGDPVLDQCELQASDDLNLSSDSTLETEKYLITVEGPWRRHELVSTIRPALGEPSNGMKKVLTKRYRAPPRTAPPPPTTHARNNENFLNKRRRPLQPGELQRQLYGGSTQRQPQSQQQQPQFTPDGLTPLGHDPYASTDRPPFPQARNSGPSPHGPQPVAPPAPGLRMTNHAHSNNTSNITVQQQHSAPRPTFQTAPFHRHAEPPSSCNTTKASMSAPAGHLAPLQQNHQYTAQPAPLYNGFNPSSMQTAPGHASASAATTAAPVDRGLLQSGLLNRVRGFDPKSFYEEEDEGDEDEEEGVDAPPTAFQLNTAANVSSTVEFGSWASRASYPSSNMFQNNAVAFASNLEEFQAHSIENPVIPVTAAVAPADEPAFAPGAATNLQEEPLAESAESTTTAAALSTQELLDLFGGALSAPEPAGATKAQLAPQPNDENSGPGPPQEELTLPEYHDDSSSSDE